MSEEILETATDAVVAHELPHGGPLGDFLHESWWFGRDFSPDQQIAHIRELCRGIAKAALTGAGIIGEELCQRKS